MIEIYKDWAMRDKVPFECFKFSGGEMQVKVGFISTPVDMILISANLNSSDDVMALLMVNDALRRTMVERDLGDPEIYLLCRYFPYARQDRVMNGGEALGARVMAELINGMKFNRVRVWDAHSDVTVGLLNNARNSGPECFVQMIPLTKLKTVLVAPDAGAVKKVFNVAKGLGFAMVTATKHRDVKNGEITGTEIHSEHIGDRDFLIVDDICDGGRTFTELAKVLRPLTNGKIKLYVTHGIFSKGLHPFRRLIDDIYCANPFPGIERDDDFLHILPSSGGPYLGGNR